MKTVEVPASPGRLINAIARIGYDPEVALCDLIDNSIDAESKSIYVELIPDYKQDEGQTDTICQYIIADDGFGMDDNGLIRAFTLGSNRDYPSGSLGKFGLGLKSASLALGDKIVLISKTKDSNISQCAILSIHQIENSGKYEIDLGEVPEKYNAIYDRYLSRSEQGTILILEDLNNNQPPFSKFLSYLKRYCSVVYHLFLENESLQIIVNNETLTAIDPLFLNEARENGSLEDPHQWNGKDVKLLLDEHSQALSNQVNVKLALTHLVHPPTFGSENQAKRQEIRDKYLIETDPYTRRARHGFYIYRNNRVIALSERFHGLVSSATQAWAFRGRLMFDESADRILSLDVKKRHCRLPKEARNNLQALIKNYQSKSIEAWKDAGRRAEQEKKQSKDQEANASIADSPISSLDYAPGQDLSNQQSVELRKNLLQDVEDATLQDITDKKLTKDVLLEKALKGDSVILADGLKGNSMWLPYPATELGKSETLLNSLHSWITQAYTIAEDAPQVTLVLHQLFAILARAELEMRSTPWQDMSFDTVEKVLERFRRKASAIGEDLADTLGEYSQAILDNQEID